MGSQVSVKTNDKEQQLKKASKMSLIRSLLPIDCSNGSFLYYDNGRP